MSWSAKQYVTFEDERTRPPRDLLAALPARNVQRAVDLGCGPGNSTALVAERFPDATVTGLDTSPNMITAARKRLPHLRFDIAGVEDWTDPDPFDLIFSNAMLQWVPGHDTLLPRLITLLTQGGSLAIQMPDNLEEPAHRAMRSVAAEPAFAAKLGNAAGSRAPRRNAEWYYTLLRPHCARVDVWLTTYHHELAGGLDAVVEWFKGSGLLPFLAPLDPAEKAAFLTRYRQVLADGYPVQPNGAVLLPFPRLFIIATR